MSTFTIFKSILLTSLIYISFILNNSISSVFVNNFLLTCIVISIILADLSYTAYKNLLFNDPGIEFYLFSLIFFLILSIKFSVFSSNFIIILAILVYSYCSALLSRFASLNEQLSLESETKSITRNNFIIHTTSGLLFNTLTLTYSNKLSFLTQADKKNFFDLIKNFRGRIIYSDNITINFQLHGRELKFFSTKMDKLKNNLADIETMLSNLLIEK